MFLVFYTVVTVVVDGGRCVVVCRGGCILCCRGEGGDRGVPAESPEIHLCRVVEADVCDGDAVLADREPTKR